MHRNRLLEFWIVALASAAFGQSPPNRDVRVKEAYNRLDAYIVREMRDKGIPGLSLALTDRHGLLRASTYGYAGSRGVGELFWPLSRQSCLV